MDLETLLFIPVFVLMLATACVALLAPAGRSEGVRIAGAARGWTPVQAMLRLQHESGDAERQRR